MIEIILIIDEKSRSSIYRISKNYGFHKFLNKHYQEEEKENEKSNNTNNLEINTPENIEKNLKEFCVDIESLCDKYEKEIGKYKKNLDEIKDKSNSNTRKTSNDSQIGGEIFGDKLNPKCDSSTNTDDLTVEDIRYILINVDKNFVIEQKGKLKNSFR